MKHKKILFSSLLVLTLFSCKKILDKGETDIIAGETALKTVAYCESAVIGAYSNVSDVMNILMNATLADEVKKGEFYNAGTAHEWQYGSSDIVIRDNFLALNPNYIIVDRVNRVLAALPTADTTKVGDNALRVRLRGEALFLRAWAHFELFRYYCSNYHPDSAAMPYMETSNLEFQARIKQGPYFQKLLADLSEAKGLVPNNLTDLNRANRTTISGLQARVSLYMRDWANAITFSTEYINALPLATIAEFPGIWTDANAKEVAYRIVRTPTIGAKLGSLWRGTSSNAANIGTVSWQASDTLWNSYDKVNDARWAAYYKDEPILAAATRPSHLIQKYAGTTYGTITENVVNSKVLRTAEMVLIRAEARAESGPFTGANSAESDINLLRSNRITGYVPVTFATKDAAMAAIKMERFKELAYEGHRFWDLKRWNMPVTRIGADAPTATAATLAAGNFRFLLPIPLVEIQSNPLMKQNPGYQ